MSPPAAQTCESSILYNTENYFPVSSPTYHLGEKSPVPEQTDRVNLSLKNDPTPCGFQGIELGSSDLAASIFAC